MYTVQEMGMSHEVTNCCQELFVFLTITQHFFNEFIERRFYCKSIAKSFKNVHIELIYNALDLFFVFWQILHAFHVSM